MGTPLDRLLLLAAAIALALGGVAQAQDGEGALDALESWITLEDEQAPEPPLIRAQGGLLAWIQTRSSLEIDGTDLENLEEDQGLLASGVGPWIEFSIGGTLRVGADAGRVNRAGSRRRQTQQVFFDGKLVANIGDSIRADSTFLTIGVVLEWDALYAETYRIGLVGGVRYFRLDTTLRGFGPTGVTRAENTAELLSPFFGGQVEVTPFPYLSVYARIQFMNWSWAAVGLHEARFLEFRLGLRLNLIPGTAAVNLEYRWMSLRAEGAEQEEGGVGANGLMVGFNLSF